MTLKQWAIAIITPLCLSLPVQAMTASQKVEVERQVKQSDGSETIVLGAPDKVLPGDMMVYTVSYHNDKQDVTENFRLDMPIPSEITYVEGSADRANTNVLYSADDGATFKSRDSLEVTSLSGGTRRASTSDITHIRWTLSEDVKPGDRGEIQFKGRLK